MIGLTRPLTRPLPRRTGKIFGRKRAWGPRILAEIECLTDNGQPAAVASPGPGEVAQLSQGDSVLHVARRLTPPLNHQPQQHHATESILCAHKAPRSPRLGN